ncbi:diguanylate cyclase domain-containing protein [Marinibaculum pumilum]|uniref:Diguanylate cyclase domain-containing protein n=1 Tax=Marinibaculum pumilum TaxID=1766165 RepID=A0ABV7L1M2_9PROT
MRILVIDDSPDDREAIRRNLRRTTELDVSEVVEAESAEQGLECLKADSFDCVLLDFSMPGASGLDLIQELHMRHPDLPMVMITGSGNERVAVDALKGGAADYVSKSEISTALLAKTIGEALDAKRQETEALRSASVDELTGLPNRRAFNERLDYLAHRAERHDIAFGIAFMDLDGLKSVNDTHGHEAGDELLRQAAARLAGCLRKSDLLARIGGDEFVAILEDLERGEPAVPQTAVDRFVTAIDGAPFDLGGIRVSAGISAGLALYPCDARSCAELLRLADEAMYRIKSARKRTIKGAGVADG